MTKTKSTQLKVMRLVPEAVLPSYAHPGDACMDVTAVSKKFVETTGFGYIEYGTGLAFEIPKGHVLLCFPRSSVSNTGLLLSNSVGVVDEGYRGELRLRFKWIKDSNGYNVGDRIGQIMLLPIPQVSVLEVDSLSFSERGGGGFGSTGN